MDKKNKKYPNGYKPKIDYWRGQLVEAVLSRNVLGQDKAKKKLTYFMGKQVELQKKDT